MLTLALLALPARAEPALDGDWKITLTLVTEAKIPVFGPTEITTTTTLLAHITGTQQRHTTCRIEPTSPLRLVQTTIPDGFTRQVPEKHYTLQLTADGAYTADFGPQHIAYDPARSPEPPAEPGHPAVLDWEGDGLPGATIFLDAPLMGRSEVYITQLAHTRLSGALRDRDTIDGQVEIVALRQHSIGARPGMFASNPEVRPLSEKSHFTMIRVPTGSTCAEL